MEQGASRTRIFAMDLQAPSVLRHGQFLGACGRRQEARGFALAELAPTVPAAEVPRHTHTDAHFVLLVEGLYISSAADALPLAQPPMLIYNPPGTTHRDRFHALDGRFFTISVSPESLRHVTEYVAPLERATAFSRGHALALARRLAGECRRWEQSSPLIAEGLGLELMAEMSHAKERSHRQPPAWLKAARELLHERCPEGIGITEIARVVGIHPIHLARTFREFFGCTPGEHLRRCRLDRAAILLAGKHLSIAGVAAEAGFADQSHFAKSFRKAFLMSPSEYRRAHVAR